MLYPYLNIIKSLFCKPRANIKLNGNRHVATPLKSGTRQRMPTLPSTQSVSLNNKTTKGDQWDTNWLRRKKDITSFR